MNQFIQAIDQSVELADNYSLTDEDDLLNHIFNTSPYQSKDEFVLANLSYHDAMEFAQSHEDFIEDSIYHLDSIGKLPISTNHSPAELAYHLAYEDMEIGTALLDELLYYRNRGRL